MSENETLRLDQWLSQKFPEKSRSYWQKQIKRGNVKVNGRKRTPHYKVAPDETVEVTPESEIQHLESEAIPLDIIFEDESMAVLNKPAGLVVHPGAGHRTGTLVHGLLHHFKGQLSGQGSDRPGIVHRLDKDTSGVLVVAKTDTAHQHIAKQFEAKTVQKQYITLVHGHISPKRGTIDAPLNRNIKNRQTITVTSRPGSRKAITHYQAQEYFDHPLPCTLLDVEIETGRTHQIRSHFKAIKHPVLGDDTYGKPSANKAFSEIGLQRQFLHAASISFRSPTTQKEVTFTAPLAQDLENVLKTLN